MAVVWIWRAAIALTPVVYRVCQSTGCDANSYANTAARWDSLLNDITADPAEISAGMSSDLGPEGGTIVVTDFTGTFELRKLQWRLSRAPAGRVEDVDVCSFHFIKATGGTPGTYNDTTDLGAVETALTQFGNTWAPHLVPFTHSDQYRWYKDGPAYYELNGAGSAYIPKGDNPAIRVTEVDIAGTSSITAVLPPQCAISVTEKTSRRKSWGRFYLPLQSVADVDGTGLFIGTARTALMTAVVTFYNSCRAASMVPVVFSIQKPARDSASGGTLAPQNAIAYEIASIQIDDIVDIIRSRRYAAGVNKSTTVLT